MTPTIPTRTIPTRTIPTRTILTLAALLSATVLAGSAAAQEMHHGHPGMKTATMGDAPSTRAFKAADAAMMRDMAVPYSGDADIDFRTHMIPHHQGAVAMAKVALAHAKDPETKAMAQAIIDDQEKEIGQMKAWLQARGR
ncbi:DUF305 domain-containing protein [uncultured Methylobacterium sp.]|uniref:CopM family metallochaperone n=1 Tax=uncultured Methylobacterium sp. TaxID=157278 RepID=UPI0035CB06FE